MDYKIVYTHSAEKDLEALDKKTAVKILRKMDYFAELRDPMKQSVKLTGFKVPTFRFRVGSYRVVFRKDKKTNCLVVLVVLKISHRKDIYSQH